MILILISSILIVSALILFITEVILVSRFSPGYYQAGPFNKKITLRSRNTKDNIKQHLKNNDKLLTKEIDPDTVLLNFKSHFIFLFLGFIFNPSRYILSLSERDGYTEVSCEIRPPYSAIVLPASLVFFMLSFMLESSPYSTRLDMIILPIVAVGVGLVVFNLFVVFRKDALEKLKSTLGVEDD
ncbi:MAG TPA: hypothetical protein ENH40_02345 [Nitrospirae bacterium]|nr:hypothetical protein [Nitrospirota bacterium]